MALRYSSHSNKSGHCGGCETQSDNSCTFKKMYETAQYFSAIYALPCVVTQLLLNNCVYYRVAIVPMLLTLFPVLIYLVDKVRDDSICDILVIGNIIFLTAFSTAFCNEYGIITAIVYSVVYFKLRATMMETFGRELIYCLAMTVFNLLILNTINGTNYFSGLIKPPVMVC